MGGHQRETRHLLEDDDVRDQIEVTNDRCCCNPAVGIVNLLCECMTDRTARCLQLGTARSERVGGFDGGCACGLALEAASSKLSPLRDDRAVAQLGHGDHRDQDRSARDDRSISSRDVRPAGRRASLTIADIAIVSKTTAFERLVVTVR